MSTLEELKAELSSLQEKLATIQGQGRVLTDCWIAKAKPGSRKTEYLRIKSRKPIFNGKKTEYLSMHGSAVVEAEEAIARGRAVKKLNKRIQTLSERVEQLQQKVSKSPKTATRKNLDLYTPPEFIALVRLVMEIDLDPASDDIAQQWIQAASYYTPVQDGLEYPWFGRVWLHPPAGGKTAKWTNKLLTEYESERVSEAILLVTPSAGSKWFQKLTRLAPVCSPDEQILFLDYQGKPQPRPNQGHAIFYFGPNIKRFKQVFKVIGIVSRPA